MTDSAMPASPDASTTAGKTNILERIEQWAADHPEALEYLLDGEAEAAEALLALAAVLKLTTADMPDCQEKRHAKAIAASYRKAVARGKATETIRAMTDADQVTVAGLDLKMRRVLLQ